MVMKLKLLTPTRQSLKISSPRLQIKTLMRLAARLAGSGFIAATFADGVYTLTQDYTLIGGGTITDPTAAKVVVLDQSQNPAVYRLISLSALIASATQIVQEITAPGPVNILPNAGIVRVNQAVGAAITLNMPLAAAKTCGVLICDWKGDAGTNNITINMAGADKLPGNLASWNIAADTGSVFLRPVTGGYVL